MKCPNCGAEMKDGTLYCEYCGEDIHIVPDFEPEVEYNMEQTLNDIVKEMDFPADEAKEMEKANPQEQKRDADTVVDVSETEPETASTRRSRYAFWGVGLFLVLLLAGLGVSVYQYRSPAYQADRARHYLKQQKYERSISCYERALALSPNDINLKFELADVYFQQNNKQEYEELLRDIVKDPKATSEQLESAYGKLIAIYRAKEDYETINELLLASNNTNIMSKYQSYIVMEPEFSIKEGYYTSIQPLKLTTFGSGSIYYTLDGSDPDETSLLYTAPILLENGDYCIKAFYVNENGTASDIVTKKYHIEIEELPSPEVSTLSGDYEFPINIEITGENEDVYYTTDGSTPNSHSNVYTGAIPMPLGKSVFKFIRIADGRSSEVVERTYNLVLNTEYTPAQAVEAVREYSIRSGKIWDASGQFDDSGAAYLYEYQYVTNINKVDDFYVVAEIYRGADGSLTKTGNFFAVNAYTQEIFKLQTDESGRRCILVAV